MKHTNDRIRNNASRNEEWYAEWSQTDAGVSRVKEWAESANLSHDSFFVSADVDEVLSRETLLRLRWCETEARTLTGALWTPLGRLDQATRVRWPAEGRPHAWAQPTIYTWGDIANGTENGRRGFGSPFGKVGAHVLGGTHLTKTSFLPNAILKEVTATEALWYPGYLNTGFLLTATREKFDREQAAIYNLEDNTCWREVTDTLDQSKDLEHYVPWFLACNPARFPYWFGKPDPRNGDMVLALRRVSLALLKKLRWSEPLKAGSRLFPISWKPREGAFALGKVETGDCLGEYKQEEEENQLNLEFMKPVPFLNETTESQLQQEIKSI